MGTSVGIVSVINEPLIEDLTERSKQHGHIEMENDDHTHVSSQQHCFENDNSAGARKANNVRHKCHYSRTVHDVDSAT